MFQCDRSGLEPVPTERSLWFFVCRLGELVIRLQSPTPATTLVRDPSPFRFAAGPEFFPHSVQWPPSRRRNKWPQVTSRADPSRLNPFGTCSLHTNRRRLCEPPSTWIYSVGLGRGRAMSLRW